MEVVIPDKSPPFSYGIATAAGDKIFIHGGISAKTTDTCAPSNSCHIFDFSKQAWVNLTTQSSPALAFHQAYVIADRFVHLIGGWNGKTRSSCLYIYDVHHSSWLPTCKTIGFPVGAGLSGHTAVPTTDGGCLITGRLGGLQTQRRFGTVLTLHPLSFPTVFKYNVVSESGIQSRSGHTCSVIQLARRSCLLLGGRDQDVVELLQWDKLLRDESSEPVILPDTHRSQYHRIPLDKPPPRRYHIALPLADKDGNGRAVLMHGGESFGSTAKGPSKEGPCTAVLGANPKKSKHSIGDKPVYTFQEWETAMPRLTGHKAVKIKDRVYILGGFGDQWKANKHLYELKL